MFHDYIHGRCGRTQQSDSVALSSAEAEYNEACLACMATAHLRQFLEDLELHLDDEKEKQETNPSFH
jgi:hypothetical protein